ncbi:MAG: Rrf2 family transcriptional regulator [Candidatus Lindowbacteria bacterium]|nr:Rrf2 family transcriptional regulator [Candidatus Lindowbacteria bacterium]
MLRISKKLDYGLIILAHLAMNTEDGVISARNIANEYGLPLPVTSGILKAFSSAGIVKSTRGVRGGHELARPSGEITFGEIAEAIEGPMQMADCVMVEGASRRDCGYEKNCPVREPVRVVHNTLQTVFERITLSHLAGQVPLATSDIVINVPVSDPTILFQRSQAN